ncbi:serine/arginine repetitive matrix protein 1-like [Zingiber officinale]|uniref:serine/arginine repetitive matrix protein 1-like n=1 Tax=Zingiber officinale TaxID=94328 RepID=UPI001C4B94CC|nr:serine/arginine repetitive matrix protein 1-like [Zingiber officinale]
MDPAKGDAKSEEEEHLIKSPSEKERKANERISPSTSSDDDDDGYSPEDLFQLDINKSPAASGQERRLQSGAQTNNFSSLIDDDAVTTPDRPRSQTDAPDPERIASSIFIGTSSNSPAQWSAASNESLFSIQGGNSSFSKDHASLSGRPGGLSPSPPSPQPHPSLGSINVATFEARREELEEAANAKAIKDAVLQARSEGQRHSEEQRRRSSDGSAKSFQSFAFPMYREGRNSSAKAESAQPLRPANKPQQQPQPETQLPKSSSAASPPAAAASPSPPPPPASAPKSKWLACCRCPSFC